MNFEDECIALLQQLISFETIDSKPEQKVSCANWITQSFFSDKNLQTGIHDQCPYIYSKHPKEEFLFFAHFDVVPANQHQFLVQIDGDIARGRGVKDMKGALLTFLMAYRDCIANGIDPPVSILLTSDEETAGSTIPYLLSNNTIETNLAFTPDNSQGLVTEHKGVVWAEIIIEGKGGHASKPFEYTNPITRLCEVVLDIHKRFPADTDPWCLTVTPTKLLGSDAHNKIPDTAICGLDIRFVPENGTAEDVIALIKSHLPDDCKFHSIQCTNGLHTDKNHPFIQKFKSIAEEVEQQPVEFYRESGATDARYFGNLGIPAFLYGPIGGGLHANDEWVSLQSLQQQYQIYKKLLS